MDWCELPGDLVISIAERLPSVSDYLCFAQVCKSWRSSVLSPHRPPLAQPPFLMLAAPNVQQDEDSGDGGGFRRGFVGLGSTDKVWWVHLPELGPHDPCKGSKGNWLVIIDVQHQVHIFNAFTTMHFHLPSISTLPEQYPTVLEDEEGYTQEEIRDRFVSKVVLSSTPKSRSSDGVIAMAVYGAQRKLAIASPGDDSWTTLQTPIKAYGAVEDIIFFNQRFYTVNRMSEVSMCDPTVHPPQVTRVPIGFILDDINPWPNKYYLVEWCGKLLYVTKYCVSPTQPKYPPYTTFKFVVYKFHPDIPGEWEEVTDLGQHSLFLGYNTSISLLASTYSTFAPNCIYFTDDNHRGYFGNGIQGGFDMGVFHLRNGTITPHYPALSTSFNSPPFWIIPDPIHSTGAEEKDSAAPPPTMI